MKKVSKYLVTASFTLLLAASQVASAATGIIGGDVTGGKIGSTFTVVITFVQDTLIPFILGIGFLVFVWGMFKYFILGADNEDSRKEGKNLVIYSVAGFVLILVFWGIVAIVANGIGTGTTGITAPDINIR